MTCLKAASNNRLRASGHRFVAASYDCMNGCYKRSKGTEWCRRQKLKIFLVQILNIVWTWGKVSLSAVSSDPPLTWANFEQGFVSLDTNGRTRNLLPALRSSEKHIRHAFPPFNSGVPLASKLYLTIFCLI